MGQGSDARQHLANVDPAHLVVDIEVADVSLAEAEVVVAHLAIELPPQRMLIRCCVRHFIRHKEFLPFRNNKAALDVTDESVNGLNRA